MKSSDRNNNSSYNNDTSLALALRLITGEGTEEGFFSPEKNSDLLCRVSGTNRHCSSRVSKEKGVHSKSLEIRMQWGLTVSI